MPSFEFDYWLLTAGRAAGVWLAAGDVETFLAAGLLLPLALAWLALAWCALTATSPRPQRTRRRLLELPPEVRRKLRP